MAKLDKYFATRSARFEKLRAALQEFNQENRDSYAYQAGVYESIIMRLAVESDEALNEVLSTMKFVKKGN